MRCAIYIRHSRNPQSALAASPQLALCRQTIEHNGWKEVAEFSDHAVSGKAALRPGLQSLLAAVDSGEVDAVVTASIDRLSRDSTDITDICERLRSASVALHTSNEGPISG